MLIFAKVHLEGNNQTTSTKEFRWAITIMNPVAITQFFEAIFTGIFKCFFITESIENDLLRLVSTYFGMIEMND